MALRHFTYFSRWLIILLALVTGCSEPVADLPAVQPHSSQRVWVAHDDWHAAVILRAADIPPGSLVEARDFPDAEYLEISWGDAEYFPAVTPGVSSALKAALWSSGSVIHIVGFGGNVAKAYPKARIIEIALADEDLRRLIGFIDSDIARDDPGKAAPASPGLFPGSRFYAAKSSFSGLRTCNTWIAEAFKTAGLPVRTAWVMTASSLARQLRPHGTQMQ
ncbi:MAG: DUF2459 domain-containing protein [Deltaproteobacteria bacterium]|nr:DUF2459 domain-containing protein [Deltaproteobacteria bacterium]